MQSQRPAGQPHERHTNEVLQALLAMAQALTTPDSIGLRASLDPGTGTGMDTAMGTAEVTRRLIESARSVLACERVFLIAVDPENEHLHPLASVGWPSETEQQWYTELGRFRLRDYLPREHIRRLRAGEVIGYHFRDAERRGLPTYGLSRLLLAPLHLGALHWWAYSLWIMGTRHRSHLARIRP